MLTGPVVDRHEDGFPGNGVFETPNRWGRDRRDFVRVPGRAQQSHDHCRGAADRHLLHILPDYFRYSEKC